MSLENPTSADAILPADSKSAGHRSALFVRFKKNRWFILFVMLPTIFVAIYYGIFASDVYISESRFVVKSADQKRSQMSTLANLIQTTGLSGGQEQTNEILAFIRSRDALKAIDSDQHIRLRSVLADGDIWARFPHIFGGDGFEDLYKYYGNIVSAHLDAETGTATIKVEAFSPEDAYAINQKLLRISEDLVNRLNARAQTNGIGEAQRQVDLATNRATAARVALTQYRNAQALIDPSRQAAGVLEISNGITAERAALQAQLDSMQRLTPRNPSLPTLRNRIAALSAQIAAQEGRVVGTRNGIASKIGGYEDLLVEQEFATQNLNVANAALVQARAEAQRQQFYLERVVDPNKPDVPLLPKRFLSVLAFAAALTCIYFVVWMFIVGILEHAPED